MYTSSKEYPYPFGFQPYGASIAYHYKFVKYFWGSIRVMAKNVEK